MQLRSPCRPWSPIRGRCTTARTPPERRRHPLNADPADQIRLLELQVFDSTLARIEQRRRSLPELAELATLTAELSQLDDQATVAQTEVRDLARAQTKLDGDVDVVRQRMDRDAKRLDSGTVTSSKELMDLQTEIESLKRRQSTLEDEELEIMQNREDAETRLAAVDTARTALTTQQSEATARLAAAQEQFDAEAATAKAAREALAPSLPADLIALYDKVRASSGGVGAAALHRRRCEGCHLEIGAAELREMKAATPETVMRCDNCRRILVRTPESGL